MDDAVLLIAATDIRSAIVGEPDLIKRLEKAFAKAQDFWMATDDDTRFRGALAAVLLETTDEVEKGRVIASKKSLDQLDAVLRASRAGVGLDLSTMEPPPANTIPLLSLWHAAKDAYKKSRSA